MLTVVETKQFQKTAEAVLTVAERTALIDFLAFNPLAGQEIIGSGGLRKVRFGSSGKGKRGGASVVYFFFTDEAPLLLITCYAKSQKSDLSRAEIAAFARLTTALKSEIRSKRP